MESKEKKLSELRTDIISLKCETLSKGKTIDTQDFHNKKGFSNERLCTIAAKIQEKVREGYDFLNELFKAQIHGGN